LNVSWKDERGELTVFLSKVQGWPIENKTRFSLITARSKRPEIKENSTVGFICSVERNVSFYFTQRTSRSTETESNFTQNRELRTGLKNT
jgi:hypothetical protein